MLKMVAIIRATTETDIRDSSFCWTIFVSAIKITASIKMMKVWIGNARIFRTSKKIANESRVVKSDLSIKSAE